MRILLEISMIIVIIVFVFAYGKLYDTIYKVKDWNIKNSFLDSAKQFMTKGKITDIYIANEFIYLVDKDNQNYVVERLEVEKVD